MKTTMRWALVPLFALGLAACGSDSKTDAASSDETSASVDAPAETSGASSGSEWCDVAKKLDEAGQEFGESTAETPDEIKAMFESMTASVGEAASVAPDEIKADVELTQSKFAEMTALLEDAGYDLNKVDQAAFGDLMVDQEATDAGDRIDAYNASECGITDDSSVTESVDTTTA